MDHLRNVLLSFFVLLLFSDSIVLGAQKTEHKNVLVIYPFRPTLPVASLYDRALRSVLKADPDLKVDVTLEHLNLSRFKDPNYRLHLYMYPLSGPYPC